MGFCEVVALVVLKAHFFASIELGLASDTFGQCFYFQFFGEMNQRIDEMDACGIGSVYILDQLFIELDEIWLGFNHFHQA